jgi:hypothetical protein
MAPKNTDHFSSCPWGTKGNALYLGQVQLPGVLRVLLICLGINYRSSGVLESWSGEKHRRF